jgi:type II secretory pathway pseudopilin PulG
MRVVKRYWPRILSLAVLGCLLWVILPNFLYTTGQNHRWGETILNTHAIQQALDRYYADEGEYPSSIEVLRKNLYLPIAPNNPYRRGEDRQMKEVDPSSTTDYLGDFTYLPLASEGKLRKYVLFCYALLDKEDQLRGDPAWRHVAACFQGNSGTSSWSHIGGK